MLELADGDHDKAERIFRWPLRAALDHYRGRAREAALDAYRHSVLCYAVTAPHVQKKKRRAPPAIPPILRGRRTHGRKA